jgi:hypothetical protein
MSSGIASGILTGTAYSIGGEMSEEKVRENRLRRMADRQGLALHKNRTRDPRARNYGLYWLRWLDAPTPEDSHDAWVGYPAGFDIDQVEAYLLGKPIDEAVRDELDRTGREEDG